MDLHRPVTVNKMISALGRDPNTDIDVVAHLQMNVAGMVFPRPHETVVADPYVLETFKGGTVRLVLLVEKDLKELVVSILSELKRIQGINFPVPSQNDEDQKRLDEIIKGSLLVEVEKFLKDNSLWPFRISGNTGRFEHRRAHVPWVGIHSPFIDSKSLEGVYLTILINSDGNGFALSVQRGVEGRTDMQIRSAIARLRVEFGEPPKGFFNKNLADIVSSRFNSSDRSRKYQSSKRES